MEFQARCLAIFLLFSVIDRFEWFCMESLDSNIQLMLEFLKAPFLVLHISYYTLMAFLTKLSVILLSMLMILLTKCDQASDLWQQLELASELESDLQDTVEWSRNWLVDLIARKTQLVLFDRSKNNGSIDLKMDGSILVEKSSFKMLGLTFSFKLDLALTVSLLLKLPPRK